MFTLEGEDAMTATRDLHDLGQSLWLDNITRDLLNRGTLKRYVDTLSLTGLTSNPTIFDQAIRNSAAYDEDIARAGPAARSTEDLFFSVALADLERAADLFQPAFARTDRVDGWVSLEVSPLLAHDTEGTVAAARDRGIDLRRRSGERHAALLRRAICRSRRRLLARHRTAHRGGPGSGGRLRRLAVREPLGRCRQGQGTHRAQEPPRHSGRPAHLQGLPRTTGFGPLVPPRQCGCPPATPAVGQHRNQGSGRLRHALY